MSIQDIKNFDIIIIPPNIEFDNDLEIDLFINTRSFMEMNLTTVNKYFNLIQSNINSGGSLLNINRYHKSTSDEDNMIANYPYDDNWIITLSQKAFLQDWMHLLLTKRASQPNSDFRDALDALNIESKRYVTSKSKRYFFNLISMISKIIPSSIKHLIKRIITTKIPE